MRAAHAEGVTMKKFSKRVIGVEFCLSKLVALADDSPESLREYAALCTEKINTLGITIPAYLEKALKLMMRSEPSAS